MKLYDGKPVDWFYGDREPDALVGEIEPIVIYDDGNGRAYGWEYLSSLCGKWGVEPGDDAQAAFDAVTAAMATPPVNQDDVTADLSQAVSDNADALAELSELVSNITTKEA